MNSEFVALLAVLTAICVICLKVFIKYKQRKLLYTTFHKKIQLAENRVNIASWDGGKSWHRVLIDIGGHMEPQNEIDEVELRIADNGISELLTHVNTYGPVRANKQGLIEFLTPLGVNAPYTGTIV